jgi:hypothetical protein
MSENHSPPLEWLYGGCAASPSVGPTTRPVAFRRTLRGSQRHSQRSRFDSEASSRSGGREAASGSEESTAPVAPCVARLGGTTRGARGPRHRLADCRGGLARLHTLVLGVNRRRWSVFLGRAAIWMLARWHAVCCKRPYTPSFVHGLDCFVCHSTRARTSHRTLLTTHTHTLSLSCDHSCALAAGAPWDPIRCGCRVSREWVPRCGRSGHCLLDGPCVPIPHRASAHCRRVRGAPRQNRRQHRRRCSECHCCPRQPKRCRRHCCICRETRRKIETLGWHLVNFC